MNITTPPPSHDLASAIADADIRVLLMVLVHMTGDLQWLEPPYAPKRDVRLIPDPGAQLPQDVQDAIRKAALAILTDGKSQPAITDPGNELMLRMMRVCLGENVAPEYAAMNREEMALTPRHVDWKTQPSLEKLKDRHVLIVGAGVCAIALGVALGKLGVPYTIVEKNAELGGTWSINKYPGCGVDTPNHSYSYSFSSNNVWTRYFSRRPELLAYLKKVANEHDVTQHVRLKTKLTASRWDDSRKRWISTLQTPDGEQTFESWMLVSAIGQINDPSRARFDGEENFKGTILHSADWPDDLSVKGKRVAVIGTGATSMQIVPTIADEAASVTVYQRTSQWARPVEGYQGTIGAGAQWLLTHVPFYAEWFRFNMFWRYGDGLLPLLRKDPEWPHPQRAVNKGNDRHRQEMVDFIHAELKGRDDLIAKCIPTYPPYGKRILLDNGWYRALLKPNVELVTEKIERVTRDGIVSDGEERAADIIVVATGFRVNEMAARLDITGRGENLRETWADENLSAYLGLTVPNYPNFFCMLGPNSGPAHGGSVIFQAECQARYISACAAEMIEQNIAAIDPKPEVLDAYVAKVDDAHNGMIWTHPGMTTYYRNRHGRVFSAMPWRFVDYWAMTHDPDLQDYRITAA